MACHTTPNAIKFLQRSSLALVNNAGQLTIWDAGASKSQPAKVFELLVLLSITIYLFSHFGSSFECITKVLTIGPKLQTHFIDCITKVLIIGLKLQTPLTPILI